MNDKKSTDHDLLIRIDEKVKIIIDEMDSMKSNYVTKEEFTPVKKLVYGQAAIVLVAVVSALASVIIK